jgi:hypothetical protein
MAILSFSTSLSAPMLTQTNIHVSQRAVPFQKTAPSGKMWLMLRDHVRSARTRVPIVGIAITATGSRREIETGFAASLRGLARCFK